MKKALILGFALALAVAWAIPAIASPFPEDVFVGKKIWQFNIIGHPNNKFNASATSNGRTIMIPLKTAGNTPATLSCPAEGVVLNDQLTVDYTSTLPGGGAKIYWEVNTDANANDFVIADRNALDSNGAKILVPQDLVAADGTIKFDIWLRVLGKPLQCMKIWAWATDTQNGTEYYFLAGTVEIKRAKGQSVFTKVNDLFDVMWCSIDAATGLCTPGTTTELGVFNNVFEDYFWQIFNDGTRLVQLRVTANALTPVQ